MIMSELSNPTMLQAEYKKFQTYKEALYIG